MRGHLGQERAQGGRTCAGEQFVGGDRVVRDHPEGHQHDPPAEPCDGAAGDGSLRWNVAGRRNAAALAGSWADMGPGFPRA